MSNKQSHRPVTCWSLFDERYPILRSLAAYGSQRCSRFTITDERALLFELVDFINTDKGKDIVTAWYSQVSHNISLIQQIANNIIHCNEEQVSVALHALNIEIDRVTTRLIDAMLRSV